MIILLEYYNVYHDCTIIVYDVYSVCAVIIDCTIRLYDVYNVCAVIIDCTIRVRI